MRNSIRVIVLFILLISVLLCLPADGREQITFQDVQWNHPEGGTYPYTETTEIYMTLSNGRQVTCTIPFASMVEGMERLDMTGDGMEEILIRQYWVDTATEYTMLYIYQMVGEEVVQLFPNRDVEELVDVPVHTELVRLEAEGLPAYGLDARTFQKVDGVASESYHALLVYHNRHWEEIKSVSEE